LLIFTYLLIIPGFSVYAQKRVNNMNDSTKLYSFAVKTIDGREKKLSDYRGRVLMIVNVASKCGNTPQYRELEQIYKKYKGKGFIVLGFPSNDFMGQEPGSNEEIMKFCTLNYGVSFDMFEKIVVKGKDQDPLYKYLVDETPAFGEVKWNFQKYLVDRRGNVAAVYAPRTKPDEEEIVEKIEELLSEK